MKPNKKQMPKPKKGVIGRLLKMLFKEYPVQLIVIALCIAVVSYASTIASIYLADFITLIERALKGGGWSASGKPSPRNKSTTEPGRLNPGRKDV